MSDVRLQKVLARAGVASRRKAGEVIAQGRVTVNGQVAEQGQRVDPEKDAIKVDGRRIRLPKGPRYLLLNKPRGYVSTRSDPQGRPTVFDLIPSRLGRTVVPVGRLDFQTEGLLLFTDDGELAQRVAHPRYGCLKTYHVKVKGRPQPGKLDQLRRGIVLDGRRTKPSRIRFLRTTRRGREANSWWEVGIGEGRTRQIREMFFRIGHPVQKLTRVAIGGLSDPRLARGAWRELSEAEVALLRGSDAESLGRSPKGKRGRRVGGPSGS